MTNDDIIMIMSDIIKTIQDIHTIRCRIHTLAPQESSQLLDTKEGLENNLREWAHMLKINLI